MNRPSGEVAMPLGMLPSVPSIFRYAARACDQAKAWPVTWVGIPFVRSSGGSIGAICVV
jgi:hypothetical protein